MYWLVESIGQSVWHGSNYFNFSREIRAFSSSSSTFKIIPIYEQNTSNYVIINLINN